MSPKIMTRLLLSRLSQILSTCLTITVGLCLLQIVLSALLPTLIFADINPDTPLTIRVGSYENHPKIYTDEAGNTVGLFPEILNYIAQKEGWNIEYVHGRWSQCLQRLEEKEIDIMVDVAFSEERNQKYDFSNETLLVNWATVYTDREHALGSLVDLDGKRVAVMKGSIHTEGEGGIKKLAAKFDITCTYIEVESYEEVFKLLADGQADAGVANRIFGSLLAEQYNLQQTPIIFNPSHLKFAFPKGAPLNHYLIEKIDHHLSSLKKIPDSIYNKAVYVYLSGLPRELILSTPAKGEQGKKVTLTSAEKTWIHNHPTIRLGADPEFAPFEYFETDGTYGGIASDYIKLLNQRLDLNMQVSKNLTWKKTVEKAKAKEIDILPCVGITLDRQAYLKFSKPYINFHRVIVTRTDTPFLTDLDDVINMKVAVQADSSHEGYLKDNTGIKPILYKTLQKALLAVSNGNADAFIGNIASSTYWIRKLNLTNLKVAAPVSQKPENLYFAVRKDWPELVNIINKGLASISREEEDKIRRRWVNIDYKPGIAPGVVWGYMLEITGVALLVLSVILLWNYRLKKEINKRIKIEEKLSEANKGLKNLDQLKSMFIASMSHELRTPLNSIIGFTGIILQGMTGELNEKQKDHLGRVFNSAKHLLSLITDIIDISKIEAGRIDVFPEEFTLAEIIDEAIINVEPQLKAKNLTLKVKVPTDLMMNTDRKRLLQCIINYLSNAVKFTETGTVTVLAREINEMVEIQVKDTGIGIARQDMPKLFEAFERLESHLRVKAGGTGLGLYLTRKLVTEILKGSTKVTSQEYEGSTFGLLVPKDLNALGNKTNHPEQVAP
ncbi:MAG: transporter substrate-binding domain-containing protein [Proteobacteria bacterium]|nr:transporter substrate-binding domain-containing protein [Pseudomonadota bacterium]MBU1717027.1 transporter substrate-binding domain-containing protein [Pseudomonadota bacterium]